MKTMRERITANSEMMRGRCTSFKRVYRKLHANTMPKKARIMAENLAAFRDIWIAQLLFWALILSVRASILSLSLSFNTEMHN